MAMIMSKSQLVDMVTNGSAVNSRKKAFSWFNDNVYKDANVMGELYRVTGRNSITPEEFLGELKRTKQLSSRQVDIILRAVEKFV